MDLIANVYLFIIFFLLAMVADHLPFILTVKRINQTSRGSLATIQSELIDDETKQKILLSNSLAILKNSLLIIALTLFLVALLVAAIQAGTLIESLNPSFLTNILISTTGIALSVIAFASYFLIKKSISAKSNSDYTFSSRLLHRIALQSKAMAEVSFEMDNNFINKKGPGVSISPVFISGLARSGTTMLMRYLYESGQFRSLTYLDMPFVMMPNVWKKLSFRKVTGELKERAHKDGIMVSFESPEAFEEVFWRVFCGDQYIGKDWLELQKTSKSVSKKFRDYIRNVILSAEKPEQNRYLSKNNNNILRLPGLFESFPDARLIIPFRDPLQHALSLLNQHLHFSEVQSKDKFSLDYMNWLGHFEFGLNQKPFHFADNEIFHKMQSANKMSLDFWLLSWKNYYTYAIENAGDKALFLSYEEFCKSPGTVLSVLFREIRVNANANDLKSFKPSEKQVGEYDQELLKECQGLYRKLLNRFNIWYKSN